MSFESHSLEDYLLSACVYVCVRMCVHVIFPTSVLVIEEDLGSGVEEEGGGMRVVSGWTGDLESQRWTHQREDEAEGAGEWSGVGGARKER